MKRLLIGLITGILLTASAFMFMGAKSQSEKQNLKVDYYGNGQMKMEYEISNTFPPGTSISNSRLDSIKIINMWDYDGKQTIKDGVGEYTSWRGKEGDEGRYRNRGPIKNGKKDGKWYYYSYGNDRWGIVIYKDGVAHGEYRYQVLGYNGDYVTIEGNYKDGLQDGKWSYYGDVEWNGTKYKRKIKSEDFYQDGKLISTKKY